MEAEDKGEPPVFSQLLAALSKERNQFVSLIEDRPLILVNISLPHLMAGELNVLLGNGS